MSAEASSTCVVALERSVDVAEVRNALELRLSIEPPPLTPLLSTNDNDDADGGRDRVPRGVLCVEPVGDAALVVVVVDDDAVEAAAEMASLTAASTAATSFSANKRRGDGIGDP